MGEPVGELEFQSYAEAHAARARGLLRVHRRDGSGCCRSCGRPHPCEVRTYAGRLIVQFEDWAPYP
ncbi:hypothetical protein Cs7R123_23290 [Catellatospora sp. TT07R-123]|nr:hypothetical protein Cs7R123_23290 [Catellatospora sp. TT07R-123]